MENLKISLLIILYMTSLIHLFAQDKVKIKLPIVTEWENKLNELKSDPEFIKEIEYVKSLPEGIYTPSRDIYAEADFRVYCEVIFDTTKCYPPDGYFGKEYEPLFAKTYNFLKVLKRKDPAKVIHLIRTMKDVAGSFGDIQEYDNWYIYNTKGVQVLDKRMKDIGEVLKIYRKTKKQYFSSMDMIDINDMDNSIAELIIQLEEIRKSIEYVTKKMS
ncbi:hypothetical protein [Borrelia duttonii]|uniref:Uncharacterized protein n=1 Tax=Borrelia duttonii (strain Ly) TaxID=412419 RepID=B5RN97_BORDL|nr:hypothetical protein BDU_1035 [Borrelia duttonii Ly]